MNVSGMIGMTLRSIDGALIGSKAVTMVTECGRRFRMFHYQDCCESVSLEEVIGDPQDLIGAPLQMAQEESNSPESGQTWTFYKFGTAKGYVTLRWLGESNGYYSESVDLEEVT